MLRYNFCGADGRLVKLFLFSTLLHKSPLTSIYFATFEKKREAMSPLPTQSKFLVFGKYYNSEVCECLSVCLCRFHLKTVNINDLILFATLRDSSSSGFKILTKFL